MAEHHVPLSFVDRVKTTFDYEAQDESNITIAVGDVLVVTDKSDSDWWEGYVEGNPETVGYFPSSYVEPMASGSGIGSGSGSDSGAALLLHLDLAEAPQHTGSAMSDSDDEEWETARREHRHAIQDGHLSPATSVTVPPVYEQVSVRWLSRGGSEGNKRTYIDKVYRARLAKAKTVLYEIKGLRSQGTEEGGEVYLNKQKDLLRLYSELKYINPDIDDEDIRGETARRPAALMFFHPWLEGIRVRPLNDNVNLYEFAKIRLLVANIAASYSITNDISQTIASQLEERLMKFELEARLKAHEYDKARWVAVMRQETVPAISAQAAKLSPESYYITHRHNKTIKEIKEDILIYRYFYSDLILRNDKGVVLEDAQTLSYYNLEPENIISYEIR